MIFLSDSGSSKIEVIGVSSVVHGVLGDTRGGLLWIAYILLKLISL